MSASLKSALLAFEALERGPRRYGGDPAVDQFRRECDRDQPYRGAQWHQAADGDEWMRRQELIRAGQADLFEAE